MKPSQQYILVVLGALRLVDSQLVPINDNVPRHLRRRLYQGKKHHSLWTQDVSNGEINGAVQIHQISNPAVESKPKVPSLWANNAETERKTNTPERSIPSLWARDPVAVVLPETGNELPRPPSGDSGTDAESKLASDAQLRNEVDLTAKSQPQTESDLPRPPSGAEPQLVSDTHLLNGVHLMAKEQPQATNTLPRSPSGDFGTDAQPKLVRMRSSSAW
jgi:hypothetical protein